MEGNEVEWNIIEWNGMVWNRMVWNWITWPLGQKETELFGVEGANQETE